MPRPPSQSDRLCDCPDIIERIREDIGRVVVGEADNATLVYVVATSRLTLTPLSLVLRGTSGSGKSVLQHRVLNFMPPDSVIDATSLTPNALYYMDEGLEHKVISSGERKHRQDDDAADANAALRQLLSEGRISKWLPMKVDGQLRTKRLEIEGPVAYVETTTARSIFAEDLNRMLQLFTDDSPKQTTAVVRSVAKRYAPEQAESREDDQTAVDRHREFQSQLQAMPVVIPYAEALADLIPNDRVEVRRVAPQVFTTVETVVLLQQFQRKPDKQGRLVATLDDYAIARRLLQSPLQAAIGEKKARESEDFAKKTGQRRFTTTEFQKVCGFKSKKVACSHLNGLLKEGMARIVQRSSSTRPAVWEWTFKPILPETEVLRYRVTEGAKAPGNARKA